MVNQHITLVPSKMRGLWYLHLPSWVRMGWIPIENELPTVEGRRRLPISLNRKFTFIGKWEIASKTQQQSWQIQESSNMGLFSLVSSSLIYQTIFITVFSSPLQSSPTQPHLFLQVSQVLHRWIKSLGVSTKPLDNLWAFQQFSSILLQSTLLRLDL